MSEDKHDKMVSDFIDYLEKHGIENYETELPVKFKTGNENLGSIDVAVSNWHKMFIFDMKNDTPSLSKDIRQIKKYVFALKQIHSHRWKDIYGFIVYNDSLKEKVTKFKNIYANVGILFLDSQGHVSSLGEKKIEDIIKSIGKFPKIKTAFRILFNDDDFHHKL